MHVFSACPWDQLTCDDQTCVPLNSLCNGTFECPDKSDEPAHQCRMWNTVYFILSNFELSRAIQKLQNFFSNCAIERIKTY